MGPAVPAAVDLPLKTHHKQPPHACLLQPTNKNLKENKNLSKNRRWAGRFRKRVVEKIDKNKKTEDRLIKGVAQDPRI